MTTCPEHNLALIYRGRDHREMMRCKLVERVPEWGTALVALAENAARRTPSPLQTYVLDRLEGRKGPEWLDRQTLEQAVRATQMLGVVMAFGATIKLGSVDRDDWDLAGRTGWNWVAAGQRGMHAAFAELQAAAFERGQGGQNYFTVFGQLYSWLREDGNRADHGPIKKLLRAYILENMDVCVGRDLLGERVHNRRKYSVQSLSMATGLHSQTLSKILVERGLIAAEDARCPSSILLVDADEGRRAAAALDRSVPFVQLPAMLNATRPIITHLIELPVLVWCAAQLAKEIDKSHLDIGPPFARLCKAGFDEGDARHGAGLCCAVRRERTDVRPGKWRESLISEGTRAGQIRDDQFAS